MGENRMAPLLRAPLQTKFACEAAQQRLNFSHKHKTTFFRQA